MNGQAYGPKRGTNQSKRGFALTFFFRFFDDNRGYSRSPGNGGLPFDDYTFMSLARQEALFFFPAGMDLLFTFSF